MPDPRYKDPEYQGKWYQANKERISREKRLFYSEHKDEIKTRLYANNAEWEKRSRWHVKYRERNKKDWLVIIVSKGMDHCKLCGYNKCFAALDFHHIEPKQKGMRMNKLIQQAPTEERIRELDKCVALCANCHRELHDKERKV